MMRTMRTAAVGLACALVLSACLITKATDTTTVSAPDAGATGFGSVFAMDEGRLVARAMVGGSPVVYVFDASGDDWVHSATITPPFGASPYWGNAVAVSGDTIAIGDSAYYIENVNSWGRVEVRRLNGGTWNLSQMLLPTGEWEPFGAGLWLSGDGLVVRSDIACDASCSNGSWSLYYRSGSQFQHAYSARNSAYLSVGADAGRFAVGSPGFADDVYIGSYGDNALRVIDSNVMLPAFVVNEQVPLGDPFGEDPLTTRLFRKVDLSGDLLAYESCCTSDDRLHVRRYDGTTYQPEVTFDVTEQSAAVAVLANGAVLVADAADGVWHVYAQDGEGTWGNSTDLTLPAGTSFATAPVTVGNKVATRGANVINVVTIDIVDTEA